MLTICEKMEHVILDLEKEFESNFDINVERAIINYLTDEGVREFKEDGYPDWFIEEHRKGYCNLELGICIDDFDVSSYFEFNEYEFQKRLREIFLKHLPEDCVPERIEYDFRDQEFMTAEYNEACKKLAQEESNKK